MDNKILEILLDMQKDLKGVQNDMNEMKQEIKDIKQDMNDRFDVVDIKLNAVETRVIKVSRKLDTTTDQVTRNIETIEEVRLKLQ